jgi:PAS domain S-box-containing protein
MSFQAEPVGYRLMALIKQKMAMPAKRQRLDKSVSEPTERPPSLRQNEEQFRLLVDSVEDYAIFILDPEGHITSWNRGAERITGYKASEITGKHLSCLYAEEDVQSCKPQRELEVAAKEGRIEDEGWRARKDGSRFWANVVTTALKDEQGRLRGYGRVTWDLTERKREMEILRQSEERFRLLTEGVQDYAIFMLDPEGRVASWNSGAERIKGYRSEEIIGKHFSCFYGDEDIRSGKPGHQLKIALTEGRFEDEGWRFRKDGSRFWASAVITPLRDAHGNLRGFSKITRDITERRAHELEKQKLISVVENCADYIGIADLNQNVVFINRAGQAAVGLKSDEEVRGTKITDYFPEEDRARIQNEIIPQLLEKGQGSGEVRFKHLKTGAIIPVWWKILVIHDPTTGSPAYLASVARDITEQKRVELARRELSAHLLNAQDKERRRIGRDLHDSVGQYLAVLKMVVDSVRSEMTAKGDKAAEQLTDCTNLADEAIKEVRTISYLLYPPMLEEMGLATAIPWYLEGFAKRSGIQTTFEIAPDFGRLSPEAELTIFRVLQETLTNVHRHSGSPTAHIHLFVRNGSVSLEVKDEGKGIPPGILDDSRRDLLGTLGVGLRGINERLRQLGGEVEVTSSERGTSVRATVPYGERASATARSGKQD